MLSFKKVLTGKISIFLKIIASIMFYGYVSFIYYIADIGTRSYVSTTISNATIFLIVSLNTMLVSYIITKVLISFRKKVANDVFKPSSWVYKFFVGRIPLSIGSFFLGVLISFQIMSIIFVDPKILKFVAFIPIIYYVVKYLFLKSIEKNVRVNYVNSVSDGFIVFSTAILSVMIFIVLSYETLNPVFVDNAWLLTLEKAENFEHGSHLFEILVRLSIIMHETKNNIVALTDGYGSIFATVLILLSTSILPFIGFSSLMDIFNRTTEMFNKSTDL